MPKTLFQTIIFTLLMTFFMVYAMICYNIALNVGGLSFQVFLMAFGELKIMWPAAFILDFFIFGRPVEKIAFRFVSPEDRPICLILAISTVTVLFMCPAMSLIASFLFKKARVDIIPVWLQTSVMNFPMAFFWQICYCGPLVRFIFKHIFKD